MTALTARPVHPFPARMAPDISKRVVASLPEDSVLLDPMCGSGSVLRAGVERGLDVIGVDIDPLAVMMAEVWTTKTVPATVLHDCHILVNHAKAIVGASKSLPWHDDETQKYISYWFAEKQIVQLTALSRAFIELNVSSEKILKVALSRVIISKDRGASLARDVSHSRPHRAWLDNDYDVYKGFLRSCRALVERLSSEVIRGRSYVRHGDGRELGFLDGSSVDAIITSPPYLNAIDYLRGHRLSLVWLGFTVSQVRTLRSNSVGSERAGSTELSIDDYIGSGEVELPSQQRGWIARFLTDAQALVEEFNRVLRPSGRAVLVIGDSFLRGRSVRNAQMFEDLLVARGFTIASRTVRDIPNQNRYLPPPPSGSSALATRMRREVVLHAIAPV